MTKAFNEPDAQGVLQEWLALVEEVSAMVERRDDRGFLPAMRRLQRTFNRLQRCGLGEPDAGLPRADDVRRAIERWRAVEPAARAWMEAVRDEAVHCRTSREVVHTYGGGPNRRGRHVQLFVRGGPDGDAG